jgi:hypothetical protein
MIVVTSELWLAARNVSFAAAVVVNKSERQLRQTHKEPVSVIGTHVNCTVLHRSALCFIKLTL